MWTIDKIQSEIVSFVEYARTVVGDIEDVTNVPVEISNRMSTTKGYFQFKYIRNNKGKVVKIEPLKFKFAKILLENYHNADIIELIKHECVHFIVDTRYNVNCGHNKVFKKYCRMLGISDETYFTADPREDAPIAEPKLIKKPHRYIGRCQKCEKEYYRKVMRKSTLENWVNWCHCQCGGKLHVIDMKENVLYKQGSGFNVERVDLNTQTSETFLNTQESFAISCKDRSEKQLLADMKKMKAFEYAEFDDYTIDEYASTFDYYWWRLLLVFDHDREYLNSRQEKALVQWLEEGQQYTVEFKDVSFG
ncbi:SprT-like domain-containing protein [Romboutsia sp.]|uniref:SprT-like domain-containing protein n=1 Tax=Romboutsia sp. TaxID=1965302 RepID=UPI002CD5539F|nr:SprT-like domain-containing protein [Romboutsia sp.]HSQ87984.1 SprT-like domain-containing protein [Romboutsia sp.]